MKKLASVIIFFTIFVFSFNPISAFSFEDLEVLNDIPDKTGDYLDPIFKHLRVRVFVHESNKVIPGGNTTCNDPESSAVIGKTGWKLPNGNWTYRLNVSSVPASVGSANLPTIVNLSFNEWQNALSALPSKPNIIRGANTTKSRNAYDSQNIIAWGRTSSGTLGVTYVRYYPSTGLVVDIDTIMNKRQPWSWSGLNNSCGASNAYDAQNVMIHELGHWYGLDDEYSAEFSNNTMFGYGAKGEVKKDTLTVGDKEGINLIYQ